MTAIRKYTVVPDFVSRYDVQVYPFKGSKAMICWKKYSNSLPSPTTTIHLLPDHLSHHAWASRQGGYILRTTPIAFSALFRAPKLPIQPHLQPLGSSALKSCSKILRPWGKEPLFLTLTSFFSSESSTLSPNEVAMTNWCHVIPSSPQPAACVGSFATLFGCAFEPTSSG